MNGAVATTRIYRNVAAALFVLLLATLAAARMELGPWGVAVALAIAAAKAALVAMFFMHLYHGSRLARVFATAGLFWLAVLLGLSMADILTRPRVASAPARPPARGFSGLGTVPELSMPTR